MTQDPVVERLRQIREALAAGGQILDRTKVDHDGHPVATDPDSGNAA